MATAGLPIYKVHIVFNSHSCIDNFNQHSSSKASKTKHQKQNKMQMASSLSRYILLSLLICSILFINHTAFCDDDDHDHDDHNDHVDHPDDDDALHQGINSFRATSRLNPLTELDIADCLADEIADQYKNQPCAAPTIPATRPQFSAYQPLLAKCGGSNSAATPIRDGVVLPVCVPDHVKNPVLSSYTSSPQYSPYIKDGKFSGIGIGKEDDWVVVVLTTTTNGPVGRTPGTPGSPVGNIDDEDDEEDILLQGINSYRTSLKLSGLIENDKAECIADEIADQYNDQPCTATRPFTTPGSLSNYRGVLAKCQVNIATTRDGIILPACVPNLVPNQVLSNYTASPQYSQYLKDAKFTGVGIGTEDNWVVLVLTTNTPGGRFIASQNVGSASHAAAKTGPIYHLVFLPLGFLVMLL